MNMTTVFNRNKNRKERKAFTLLEVLLSAAIGVLLMAALYVAMNVQLDHAHAGREAVEQSLLVRALFRRISNDISPSLAAPPAPVAAPGGPVNPMTTPSSGSSAATTSTSNVPVLNLQGDSERMILWVSRISADLSPLATNQPVTSDLHRVTYWLAGGDSAPLGLARQEVKQATSDDALVTVPPDIPDEPTFVIAEEVQSVSFQYFDGTAWQGSWDGTQTSGTSNTPMGPPQAVAITLTVKVPNTNPNPDAGDVPNVLTFRHVVAIPTANGATPQTTSTTSTMSTSTTGQ
jgi:prepilin-type N-terminal cleavage/methylation domain-containing protein